MSNLGPYQEIVTAAARVGGVENLIRTIESAAVARAAPGLLGKGAGIGALVTLAAGGAYFGGRWLWSTYEARADAAAVSKEQLRAALTSRKTQMMPTGASRSAQETQVLGRRDERAFP